MTTGPETPTERAARLRGTHSYGIVLVLVFVQFMLFSAAGSAFWVRIVGAILTAVILLVVYLTSGVRPKHRRAAELTAAGAVVVVIASLVPGGAAATGTSSVVAAVLMLAAAITILRGLGAQPVIDLRTVLGALSVYLMIGLFFAYIYGAVADFSDQPFFADGKSETLAHLLYYSYVTQTTVGYGDFTAATNLGHSISVIEALTGQLFLVLILGLIVGNLGRTRQRADA